MSSEIKDRKVQPFDPAFPAKIYLIQNVQLTPGWRHPLLEGLALLKAICPPTKGGTQMPEQLDLHPRNHERTGSDRSLISGDLSDAIGQISSRQKQPKFKVPKSLATDFVQSPIWSLALLEAVCSPTNGGARC